jgi:hypothetical protein
MKIFKIFSSKKRKDWEQKEIFFRLKGWQLYDKKPEINLN